MHRSATFLFAAAGLAAVYAFSPFATQAEPAVTMPAPAPRSGAWRGLETAVLRRRLLLGRAGAFTSTPRASTNAVSGYAGGAQKDADYETVSSGRTGHAEAVKVTFDPRQITYGRMLQIYFSVAHDPTSSIVRVRIPARNIARRFSRRTRSRRRSRKAYIAQLDAAHVVQAPIVTKIGTMKAAFFPAEDYHQDYAINHPQQPYIAFNDLPKVEHLKAMFPAVWRDAPVTVAQADKGE